jgi:hypothetical protein
MAKLGITLNVDELPVYVLDDDDSVLNFEEYRNRKSADPPSDTEGRLVLTVSQFLEAHVPPDYVIDGLFKRGYLYSFTAMTGAGKTAIWLLISEIASNRKRRGKLGIHEVEHVRVVYIACENATDVRERLIGMEATMGFSREDLDLLVIDKVFDLKKELPRIRKEVENFGGNVGLVVIDTSAAMFQGEDENNNQQALEHAKTQRKLCELPGRPCVVALAHPTKVVVSAEHLLPRGGGAYLNEVDGNFTAWGHDGNLSTMSWAGKLRGPTFDPIEFRMRQITTPKLVDRKGRQMPTVAAEVITDAEVNDIEETNKQQEDRLLAAMVANSRGSLSEWAIECGWFQPKDKTAPYKALVQRVLKRLVASKLIKNYGRGYSISKPGKSAAKRAETN